MRYNLLFYCPKQHRLVQSKEEIQRLRSERKKLMENGNEMRSALMKLKQQQLFETRDAIEDMREQNVNTIYHWMHPEMDSELVEDSVDGFYNNHEAANYHPSHNEVDTYHNHSSRGRHAWEDRNQTTHSQYYDSNPSDFHEGHHQGYPLRPRSKSPVKKQPDNKRSVINLSSFVPLNC